MDEAAGDGRRTLSAADLVERFSQYARAARGTAMQNKARGDRFGEQLANRRAQVYDEAATLVEHAEPPEAARQMMDRAATLHVRTPPLVEFDTAGLRYIASRAWQLCALDIDPGLDEAAPAWD